MSLRQVVSRHSVGALCVSGPLRGGVNSRAMREMFRSYVEMLVSTALDPDMIQALEDTDGENSWKLTMKHFRRTGEGRMGEGRRQIRSALPLAAGSKDMLHVITIIPY